MDRIRILNRIVLFLAADKYPIRIHEDAAKIISDSTYPGAEYIRVVRKTADS